MNLPFTLPKPIEERVLRLLDSVYDEMKTNERLKWFLCAACLVLYVAALLFFMNQASFSKTDYLGTKEQLARLAALTEETGWPDRAEQAEVLVGRLNQRFWPGDTTGLAEAGFERWIRQTFNQHGTEVRQVQLTRGPALEDETGLQPSSLPAVQRIRAKVIGPLREDALLRFLGDSAENQSWVIVEQLIIRGGRNPRFELDLATFVESEEQGS